MELVYVSRVRSRIVTGALANVIAFVSGDPSLAGIGVEATRAGASGVAPVRGAFRICRIIVSCFQ